MLRAVIDTNVVFEGSTKQGSAPGWIIECWVNQLFVPCVSTALALEYEATLTTKLSEPRWQDVKPLLGALLNRCEYVDIFYRWRPSSPDPDDDHVIDCAMNAGVSLVTSNLKDFRRAETELGLTLLMPSEFLQVLAENWE